MTILGPASESILEKVRQEPGVTKSKLKSEYARARLVREGAITVRIEGVGGSLAIRHYLGDGKPLDLESYILELVERVWCTDAKELASALGVPYEEAKTTIDDMVSRGQLQRRLKGEEPFYTL